MFERLKRLNIFARIKELEARETERDDALELIIINQEAMSEYLRRRLKAVEEQNVKLNKLAKSGYSLDIENDLDVI